MLNKDKTISKLFALYIFLIMITAMEITFVSATQTFKQGDNIDLKLQCIINGTYCSAAAFCNVTISYPNATLLINNKQMTNQISFYNYTLPSSTSLGPYLCSATCCDAGRCGTGTDCDFVITPTGGDRINSLGIFIILILASIAVLGMALAFQNGYVGFIAGCLFLVTGVYVMIYGLGNLSDTWTQSVSYVILGMGLIFCVSAGIQIIGDTGFGISPNGDDD